MKKIIFTILAATIISAGCTSNVVDTQVSKQDAASQQVLNELKNGVSIYFDRNSSQVEARYHAYLAAAAQGLAQNSNFILELEGHTDSTGSVARNKKVSLERANSVRNKLVLDYNVNPQQVRTLGAGSAKPIDSNNTAEGRANNRRVSATLKIQ